MEEKKSRLKPTINFFFTLPRFGTGGKMVAVGIGIVVFLLVMTVLAPIIAPHDPNQLRVGPADASPSWRFPMGTNRLGQDILSRMIAGGSTMLEVAALSVGRSEERRVGKEC